MIIKKIFLFSLLTCISFSLISCSNDNGGSKPGETALSTEQKAGKDALDQAGNKPEDAAGAADNTPGQTPLEPDGEPSEGITASQNEPDATPSATEGKASEAPKQTETAEKTPDASEKPTDKPAGSTEKTSEPEASNSPQSTPEKAEASQEPGNNTRSVSYMFEAPKKGEKIAIMKTNLGDIKIKFLPECAPIAVENFLGLAEKGYYDGLTFHRVMNEFMIQGGDPLGNGTGGESLWIDPFEDEFAPEARNVRGALSMANSGANTNGSQFFIVQKDSLSSSDIEMLEYAVNNQNEVIHTLEDGTEILMSMYYPAEICNYYLENGGTPWLDFKHTVFGMVIEGMDIVDKIATVETGANDKPVNSVIIEKIVIQKV